jgi:hypothetical protein
VSLCLRRPSSPVHLRENWQRQLSLAPSLASSHDDAQPELVALKADRLRQQIDYEKRLFESKLASAGTPTAGASPAAFQGEVTPVVRNIIRTTPGVPLTQVTATLNSEFLPENLHKLRRSYDRTHDDVELAPNGNFVVKKAKGKSKDFGTERIWSEGFLTYVQIIGYLFPEHFATSLAMIRFHSRVVELSRVYQWSAVFNLAMDYHNTVRSDSVLVVDAWLNIPEHIVYAYCYAGTVRTAQH